LTGQDTTKCAVDKPGWDKRFDMRSFGEPLRALRAIRIDDGGEPLVDLRVFCPDVLLKPGCLPFLRETVARRVNDVQRALPDGLTLAIGTALRTLAMQESIATRLRADLLEKHPEWPPATLQRMLNRMVAPPHDISPPPHTTGGALDVGLRGRDGEDLDCTSPGDFWSGAATYWPGLSDAARANRALLIEHMEGAGLTNYVGEWWHWSWGDQGWALRVGSPVAYYGPVEVADAEAQRIPKPEDDPVPPVAKPDEPEAQTIPQPEGDT